MNGKGLMSVDEALEVLLAGAHPVSEVEDVPALEATGHELVETRTEGSAGSQVYRFLIRRKSE